MRSAAVAFAVAAAAALVLWLTWSADDPNALPPAPAPAPSKKRKPWKVPPVAQVAAKGDAALWLRRQWLHTDATDSERAELGAALAAAGVTRVYPFLGPMNAEGIPGWRSLSKHTAWEPSRMLRLDGVRVLPWTGGVAVRDVHWDDEAQLGAFAEQLQRAINAGADGIHLNIEPVADGEPGFVRLLERVKGAIGPEKELSAAVVAPRHARIEVGAERYWSLQYLGQVCGPADELVVMGYDTWLTDADAYRRMVADWTEQLGRELPPDCDWRMGVPTYDDDIPHHKLDVERIDVALEGVRAGLSRLGETPEHFRGVALYASWTTDAQEWAAYDAVWRALPPTAREIPEPVR